MIVWQRKGCTAKRPYTLFVTVFSKAACKGIKVRFVLIGAGHIPRKSMHQNAGRSYHTNVGRKPLIFKEELA